MTYDDILLDHGGDLRIDETGDAVLGSSLIQRVDLSLKWFLGEWPFDESLGTDWFGQVFVKDPDEDDVRYMIEDVIRGIDGITDVSSVTIEVDDQKRKASILWAAITGQEQIESEVIVWGSSTG